MPQHDPYEDELQNAETFPALDEEPQVTSELEDQYLNTEIFFLRGNRMARGQVVCYKGDVNSNPSGRSNQNPFLDTYLYEVEFPWGGYN